MKCLVCGKVYQAAECPRCRFPDIQIMGDRESALESLKPTIRSYRSNFLGNVTVELMMYHWKDHNGQIVLNYDEHILLGTAANLLNNEVWLANKFARIPDLKTITVTLRITAAGASRKVEVSVPNLLQPELQQLGASVDDNLNLCLRLRNETEQPTRSAPIPLLAD